MQCWVNKKLHLFRILLYPMCKWPYFDTWQNISQVLILAGYSYIFCFNLHVCIGVQSGFQHKMNNWGRSYHFGYLLLFSLNSQEFKQFFFCYVLSIKFLLCERLFWEVKSNFLEILKDTCELVLQYIWLTRHNSMCHFTFLSYLLKVSNSNLNIELN